MTGLKSLKKYSKSRTHLSKPSKTTKIPPKSPKITKFKRVTPFDLSNSFSYPNPPSRNVPKSPSPNPNAHPPPSQTLTKVPSPQ